MRVVAPMVPTSTTENSGTGGHHANGVTSAQGTFFYTDINDYTFVTVVVGVKDQRLERRIRVAGGGGNIGDHPF